MFTVYGLIDPRNGELRYVGKTKLSPEARLQKHIGDSVRRRTHRDNWIRSVIADGLRPEAFAIERHETEGAAFGAERDLISYFRYVGCRLTNLTNGGEGVSGRVVTEDTRRRLSALFRGRATAKTTTRGRTMSLEARRKMSAAKLGRPSARKDFRHSDESRTRMSASHLARFREGATPTRRSRVVDDLGNEFASVKEAAQHYGLHRNSVSNVLSGLCQTARGRTFRRLEKT